MTDHETPASDDEPRPSAVDRPPRSRTDPAAMRETLDAARRRLGPSEGTGGPAPSAEHQRALLREAAANHASPLAGEPRSGSDPPPTDADDRDRTDDPGTPSA